MNLILLAISTVASCIAACAAYLALGHANETSFRQYQAQELADYAERRKRVERVANLVESIYGDHPALRTGEVAHGRLIHALVGLHDRLPTCVEIAKSDVHQPPPNSYWPAVQELQRELTVIEAACDIVRARRMKHSPIVRWLNRNKSQLPYPKATAP